MAIVLVGIGACGTDPPVPTTIVVTPTSVSFTALGQTQQVSFTALDENGAILEDVRVAWNSSNTGVATVSSEGLVTAVANGSTQVTATVGAANAAVEVTVSQTASQLIKVAGDAQIGTVGQPLPLPLTIELIDALGNRISGATVNFTVIQGRGTVASPSASTDANGRAATVYTIGTTAGPNHRVSVTSEAASISAAFLARAIAGPPASVTVHTCRKQSGVPGAPVPVRPAVRVTDMFGNPVSGIGVVFAAGQGSGSVSGTSSTTNNDGVARVGGWTLGAPSTNTLTATVDREAIEGNPVIFTATGISAPVFDINVCFLGSATPAQEAAFAQAESRWESVITGDLSNAPLVAEAGECGEDSPPIEEMIDDVLILASVEEIDGPGATLAQAGPCFIRNTSSLPGLGLMNFDAADLAQIEAAGALSDIVLHEMGHVLGIGSLWGEQNLLADPTLSGGTDPHFVGAQAIAAFDDVGGISYAGAKVPVENVGGAGTADGHWRESVMDEELMTGFVSLSTPLNPLSIVTIASLADQGYAVDMSAADAYSLNLSSLRIATEKSLLHLGDDRLHIPIRRIDEAGRVVEVIRR